MSSASTTASDHSAVSSGSEFGAAALEMAMTPIRFVGFWAAVALPFLYLPLLFDGLSGGQGAVFIGLVAVNIAALVAGHNHGKE